MVHQEKSSSDHNSESCACSLPLLLDMPLCFPFPFPFLLFSWRPSYGLDCQTPLVSSHIHKHDLSSSTLPYSPVTSSLAHCPKSSSAYSSTMKVLFMLLTCPREGFSINLFGVQNNSRNVVFTALNLFVVILWCVRIQSRLTSCYYFNIFLGHVGKILISPLFFTQCGQLQVVHPSIFQALQRQ